MFFNGFHNQFYSILFYFTARTYDCKFAFLMYPRYDIMCKEIGHYIDWFIDDFEINQLVLYLCFGIEDMYAPFDSN